MGRSRRETKLVYTSLPNKKLVYTGNCRRDSERRYGHPTIINSLYLIAQSHQTFDPQGIDNRKLLFLI